MRDRHEVEPSGPRRFVPAHCRARSGPGRSMPRRGTKSLRRATRQVFAGLKSWPRLRLESGTLILRLLWLTPSYHAQDLTKRRYCQAQILPSASCAECSRAFRVEAPANGQASSRSGALGTTTGFSTCPHRRHSRRASIFTMFMPHFGHGGRTSKQVNGCSLSGGSFARSVGKPDRSSGGCGQRLPSRRTAQWIASLPIILYFYYRSPLPGIAERT